MATNKLTATAVRQARPREKEYEMSDGGGLALRVKPDGRMLWSFRYTSPTSGKQERTYLGSFPDLPLAAARDERQRQAELIARCIDPKNATALLDEVSDDIPDTVSRLHAVWFTKYVTVNRAKAADQKAIAGRFERYVRPVMGDVRLPLLRRGHIMKAIDGARENGGNRTANLVLAEMRQTFTFAVAREWMQGDPTAAIKRKDAGGTDAARDRVLSDDELKMLRDVLAREPAQASRYYTAVRRVLPVRTELMLWWTLATAARAVEVATLRPRDVREADRIWTIPATIAKNGVAHTVHLSDFALAVWARLCTLGGEGYVFEGRTPGTHLSEKEVTRRLTDRQSRETPVKGRKNTNDLNLPGGRWTQHDLRRTAATIMGELGVATEVIDRCLNHVERKKVTRTYQRQTMLPQRQVAFDALGAHLTALLGNPNSWLPSA